ncbi:beta-lactamase/transpeptidase-like protein [Leucosporidium creatinivorum]|uniref:Beta-lactamase/transpeptidase-like protein n=1 Tax=Leucosporidium creatinivorum TaxID=106004 RepID=A0A1Y2F4H5_9BASI|nr:beta-lactamase/transpeptidase-like protein [Leucosporidium creatinivorum]
MSSFDPCAAAKIDAILKRYTKDPYHSIPRVVIVAASSNEVLYAGSAGYEQLPPHPASPVQLAASPSIALDSVFDLWSATKLVAVVAILQLIEQGLVGVEDPAELFVPEAKNLKLFDKFEEDGKTPVLVELERPVTVEMLMTHTAGFTHSWHEDTKKVQEYYGVKGPTFDGATRESITKVPVFFAPGKHWNYGHSNDWLTLIVEKVSGLTLEEYFQQHIFKPLGITDLSFLPNPRIISLAHAPTPYTFHPGSTDNPEQNSGSSGLRGSAPSFLRILRAILNDGELDGARILKKETVPSMFEGHLSKDEEDRKVQMEAVRTFAEYCDPFAKAVGEGETDWGYGGMLTAIGGTNYPHGRGSHTLTWAGATGTHWIIDKKKDIAFVLFFNAFPFMSKPNAEAWAEIEPLLYSGAGKA